MAIRGLAEYFVIKYANNELVSLDSEESKNNYDESMGMPISPNVVQKLKDNMVRVYDIIKDEVRSLPEFKKMYSEYGDLPIVSALDNIMDAYVVNIAEAPTLKESLFFGIKYVDSFNKLRNSLSGMIKDKQIVNDIDHAIYTMQMNMWPKIKSLLSMHVIGKNFVPMNEEERIEIGKILDDKKVRGTWQYGPLPNPTKPPFQKYTADTAGKVINRVKKEILKDEVAKELGNYKTDLEINDKVESVELSEKDRKAELASLKNRLKDRIKVKMKGTGATSQDVKEALNEELVRIYSALGKGASEADFKKAILEKINKLRLS